MQENRENTGPEADRELDETELNEVSGGQSNLDSMSEMGETESLRLQMVMERMTKANSAQSNLAKKVANATDNIIGNMK